MYSERKGINLASNKNINHEQEHLDKVEGLYRGGTV